MQIVYAVLLNSLCCLTITTFSAATHTNETSMTILEQLVKPVQDSS